jgi:porin
MSRQPAHHPHPMSFSVRPLAAVIALLPVGVGADDRGVVPTPTPWYHRPQLAGDMLGLRPALAQHGFEVHGSLITDYSRNLHGGLDTEGDAFRHLLNAGLTVDLEKLAGWPGATLYANFQQQSGRHGGELTGDLQGFSNIDADGRTQLADIWLEQWLWEERLRLKAGKFEATTEFAYVEHGARFINSSMGYSPNILGIPTHPDPAVGALGFIYPDDGWYLGAGIFDGAGQRGVRTGSQGPATVFGPPGDAFLVGEAGARWDLGPARLPGRLGAGVWHHTGDFAGFDSRTRSGTTGTYLVLDQQLWLAEPDDPAGRRGLAAFLQRAWADDAVSPIAMHVGAGLTWTGPLPARADDVLGLGFTYVHLSDASGAGFGCDYECAIECFYRLSLTPAIHLQPDIQYILHSGGVPDRPDALVATLRVVVEF